MVKTMVGKNCNHSEMAWNRGKSRKINPKFQRLPEEVKKCPGTSAAKKENNDKCRERRNPEAACHHQLLHSAILSHKNIYHYKCNFSQKDLRLLISSSTVRLMTIKLAIIAAMSFAAFEFSSASCSSERALPVPRRRRRNTSTNIERLLLNTCFRLDSLTLSFLCISPTFKDYEHCNI